jgi:hypothetical protein
MTEPQAAPHVGRRPVGDPGDDRTELGQEPRPAKPGADDGPGPGDAGPRWRRIDPVAAVLGLVVVGIPLVALAVALRRPWVPTGDWAAVEMAVRDVGTGDTPLVGAYSRFGWHHPGPLPFYALALPFRLAPDDRALLVAAAVVNLVATLGCVGVVARWPRTPERVALAGLAVFLGGLGPATLADPWNPTIALVPFALVLLLAVELAADRARWALPLAVGVGSFVVQAHLGMALPVVIVLAVALVARHRSGRPVPRRQWWVALAIAGVLWAPPLADQLAGDGNLAAIAEWTLGLDETGDDGEVAENDDGRLPPVEIERTASWLFDPTGMWLGRLDGAWYAPPSTTPAAGTLSPFGLVATVVALYATVRLARRTATDDDPDDDVARHRALPLVAGAGIAGLVLALALTRGVPYLYAFRPAAAGVMLVWVGLAVQARGTRAARIGAVATLAVALVAGGRAMVVGLDAEPPVHRLSAALVDLRPDVDRVLAEEPTVATDLSSIARLTTYDLGLAVLFERAGADWLDTADPPPGVPRYEVVGPEGFDPATMEVVGRADVPFDTGDDGPFQILLVRLKG